MSRGGRKAGEDIHLKGCHSGGPQGRQKEWQTNLETGGLGLAVGTREHESEGRKDPERRLRERRQREKDGQRRRISRSGSERARSPGRDREAGPAE